jgi:hypothetical protein
MHHSTVFGRALSPAELSSSRYLDALIAYRNLTGLRMEDDGGDGDKGADGAKETGGDAGDGDKGKDDGKDGGSDKGYPANTPIAEMTAEQRAAFFEEKARTEENRRKEIVKLTGGKYGAELKADMDELARLRTERLTDSEKAVEEARTTTRAEVAKEYAEKFVAAKFEAALSHVDEDRREQLIEGIALSKFLDNDGNVDTAKVKAHAAAIAPAQDTGGSRRDFGQGARGNGQQKSGVAAGQAMFAERKKPINS